MKDDSDSSAEYEDAIEKSSEMKKKGAKKRKKKILQEPQKPPSAYALFFRDTQAAIKAENSMATFGEISKIVASMWDSLCEEAKQVYKVKTEAAKREYLKQLAAYRASKEEAEKNDFAKTKTNEEQKSSDLPPPPKLKMAPNVVSKGICVVNSKNENTESAKSSNASTVASIPVKASNDGASEIPAVQQIVLSSPPVSASPSNPPPIQLRNIVPKSQGAITILQSKPGQVIKLITASQVSSITNRNDGKNRIIKVTDLLSTGSTTTSQQTQQQTQEGESEDVQPILLTLAQETNNLNNSSNTSDERRENGIGSEDVILVEDDQTNQEQAAHPNSDYRTPSVRICIRDGCEKLAVSNSQWHDEYCSAECVVTHCRDVFEAWTSLRRLSAVKG